MKRKRGVLCVLLLLCFGFTACGRKDSTENSVGDAVKSQETKNSEGELEEQLIDLKKYSLEYENGSDQQTCFAWNQMAKSDLGYYMKCQKNMNVMRQRQIWRMCICIILN